MTKAKKPTMTYKEIEKLLRIFVPSKTLLGSNREKLKVSILDLALREKWRYAERKCKEQREIIAQHIQDVYNFDGAELSIPPILDKENYVNKRVNEDILDAPEPNFE